jgi:hypothetical protein
MPSRSASCGGGLSLTFILTQRPLLLQAPEGGGVTVRVFYRGRRVLITQHALEVAHVGRLRYALEDLSGVYIVQHGPASPPGAQVMGLSALVAAVLVVPILEPASNVLAVLAFAVFLAGGVLRMRRRPSSRWELVARHEGRLVTLFESEDQAEFDQVCRGLRRALEHRRNIY